jgi:hypothetical protein
MSKIFRTVVASSIIGGVALLSPLSAEAKTGTALPLGRGIPMAACDGSANGATGTLGATSYAFTTPPVPAGAAYEYRLRVFSLNAKGAQVFSKIRSTSPTGNIPATVKAYRLDIVDTNAEAQGLPALVFTSDGLVGCD